MHAPDADCSAHLIEQVKQALADHASLKIRGGNSKAFLGRTIDGIELDTRHHRGIVNYDPTELVITARAGTSLTELETALDAAGQMLPFEPPFAAEGATIGGVIAAGISGPRRPWVGAARDFVLGTRVITGHGQHLRFGGEVMKNVAGYDLSRLFAGSFGCLGILTEVSLKVLPKPRNTATLALSLSPEIALAKLAQWGQQPLPISAAAHDGDTLYLRLEGGEGSVKDARARLGGEEVDSDYWLKLNARQLPFFADTLPLWRISLPNHTPLFELPGRQFIDWGGAQRWLKTNASANTIRSIINAHGGSATCYTQGITDTPFEPLPPLLLRYHQQLKSKLDPHRIFNPGRMYPEL